ncbi:MAG TPA: hypothetical protein VIW24_21880 [Aldersonia sp.]
MSTEFARRHHTQGPAGVTVWCGPSASPAQERLRETDRPADLRHSTAEDPDNAATAEMSLTRLRLFLDGRVNSRLIVR